MKQSFQPGASAKFEAHVTEDMLPVFDGKKVFPVMSTAYLVQMMEAASHRLMHDHLDDDEEALGCAISIEHLATCGVGKDLTTTAELVEYRHRRARVHTSIFEGERLIATGIHIQRVMPKPLAEAAFQAGCC